MQQGSDCFVDNVKWWTQQCERVDVPPALIFLLLVWFPCELQCSPAIFAGCVIFSVETCPFAVICCVLTRCWEAANASRGEGGGGGGDSHVWTWLANPANGPGAARQKVLLIYNTTLCCACQYRKTPVLISLTSWILLVVPEVLNCHTRLWMFTRADQKAASQMLQVLKSDVTAFMFHSNAWKYKHGVKLTLPVHWLDLEMSALITEALQMPV